MKSTKTLGNKELIREINRSIILNVIRSLGPIDRAEIARNVGLSPATVSGITADLIRDDLVIEKEPGDSRGGRRPIRLAINPKGGFVVGVKLMRSAAAAVLTDFEANITSRIEAAFQDNDPETVLSGISDLTQKLLKKANIPRSRLQGVGVGLAGIINHKQGILRESPDFGWKDLPIRDMLTEKVHAPVFIDNNVNALTISEKWFGITQNTQHFLVISIGSGVGLGIVSNGELNRGVGGGAGEFGHIPIQPNGPLCRCGKTGCLEALVGEEALIQATQAAYKDQNLPLPEADIQTLIRFAGEQDPTALKVFFAAGEVFGKSIAGLINLFNPQNILITGEGTAYGDAFFKPMTAAIKSYTTTALFDDVTLHIESLNDDDWARGAASLVLQEIFASPQLD
jgi:predicted NBD/HSP70 family sugar kinase